MAKLKIERTWETYQGRCRFSADSILTETENPYSYDTWVLHIGTLTIVCTAARQILEVYGYQPSQNWQIVREIDIPQFQADMIFSIDEPFDQSGRYAQDNAEVAIRCSPVQRALEFAIGTPPVGPETFVSPHKNFIVGAAGGARMILAKLYFLDVEGLPSFGDL